MSNPAQAREAEAKAAPSERFQPPTLRRFVLAHKRASAVALGVLAVIVALAVVTGLDSRVSRIADASPCSLWSSATQRERDAYATRYVKDHGPLPSGASDPGTIEGVIDDGCTQAYGFDEADSVTVLQAVRHQY
jgi:Flp pilus assembly pilin Flp